MPKTLNDMAITGPDRERKGMLNSVSGRTHIDVKMDKLGKGIVQIWRDDRLMHTHTFAREDNIDQ